MQITGSTLPDVMHSGKRLLNKICVNIKKK